MRHRVRAGKLSRSPSHRMAMYRNLVTSLLDHEKVEGLRVAMPERDLLWLGVESDARLPRLMAQNKKQRDRSDHPLSAQIYRMTGGELVPVTSSGSES